MNKSDLRGFRQVFMFEFMTGIKKTGFKIFLAIMCAMAFFTMPIMLIVSNIKSKDNDADKKKEQSDSAIESVYIFDETGLSIDYTLLNELEDYAGVSFVTDNDISYDDAVDKLRNDPTSNNLVIKNEYDSKNGFDVTIVRSPKTDIGLLAIEGFEDDYKAFFREEVLKSTGISEDDYEYLSKDINVTIMKTAKDGSFSEDKGTISHSDYFVMFAGLMILFMLINMSVGNVATSIATEKSSRVIEYLLTGTRPLALLSGKIAARLLETTVMIFSSYSSYFLSQLVCTFLMAGASASGSASNNVVVVASMWETITLPKLLVAVLYFLAGLFLFTIIGALAGASVSKLDELQDAYKLYSFIMVISVYADMFLIIMMLNTSNIEALRNFCAIFPLTGAFLTPALILTGKISILTGIIALIVIIIATALTFILAAAVYESMLLFQGKRLQIKDVIALMKKQVVV